MAEGEGLIKGGGRPTTYSQVRASKVRKYGRRLDIRSVMRPYPNRPTRFGLQRCVEVWPYRFDASLNHARRS